VTLQDPPLAAAAFARRFAGFGPRRKLNLASAFSRSYLSSLEAEQVQAIATLHREIPEARVSRRYELLVNGFAVSVPYARLPELMNLESTNRVYPSLTYTLAMNRGPSVIGATQFSTLTGAKGDGVKVAVVDDGVDPEHPFLDPTGFSYPPGFPKGPSGGTSPKVIVARGFAGPGANSAPLDRDQSFHGTFVAGVIAGVPTDVATNIKTVSQRGRRRLPPRGEGHLRSGTRATSATTASSTYQLRPRSAAAARRTARRSSPRSRLRCATGWT
jgi:subtilisin family serine protease